MSNPFRQLPAVNELLHLAQSHPLGQTLPRRHLLAATRRQLDVLRTTLRNADTTAVVWTLETLVESVCTDAFAASQPKLRTVINATGIILHTNLGRAPMAEAAAKAVYDAARNYVNLELDLATGERSSRQKLVRSALCELTGAPSATVVNNCAAATVMVLRAVAPGKEVIVSRGELIEIGGSFRLPDIMASSGAILKEVGTTNITRLRDYERAIGPNTAAILRVHTSNYRIRGFTDSVPIADLVALGHAHNLCVIDDVGSGRAFDLAQLAGSDEPDIRTGIGAGADLVIFSGDKLLGGPQAGIIAGQAKWIQAIESDPFMRAVRTDKLTLAALLATLELHADPELAWQTVPVLRMLREPLESLRSRATAFAERLREQLPNTSIEVMEQPAFAGGGTLPDTPLASIVVVLTPQCQSLSGFAAKLRTASPAVLARIHDGRILFDLRTVLTEQEPQLEAAIVALESSRL